MTSTFSSGESLLNLPIGIVDDETYEGLEDFSVQFVVVGSESVEADPARQTATVTISDNEDSKENGS